MGDVFAFSSEMEIVAGKSKPKSSPGGALRKTLADVTNIYPKPKPSVAERKSEVVPSFAKDMDRLNKENEALKKENLSLKLQLAERNQITELSATELQKLRLNLQSLYQQNLQLAQANSQMLAELNSGKDRLKALHHEVGCLKGLLNVKTLVQDEKRAVDSQQTQNKVPTIRPDTAGESSHAENTNNKRVSANIRRSSKVTGQSSAKDTTEEKSENRRLSLRRKSSRLKSEEPACTDDPPKLDDVKSATTATTDKEKSENKRLCVRRQSSRFKSEEPASSEDLFELDDIKLPMLSQVDEAKSSGASVPLALSDNGQDSAVRNSTGSISAEERRMSLGRPSRRAAEKVHSYREIPINVKMRRSS